jgi:hypothetical protein
MSHRRTAATVVLAIAAAVALVIGAYARWGDPVDPFDNRRFSATEWHAAEAEGRAKMCRDLIRNHLRSGMAEQQVFALLGETGEVHDDGPDLVRWPGAKRLARYYLGGFSQYRGMDDAWLYVYFDGDRRLLGAEVYGY